MTLVLDEAASSCPSTVDDTGFVSAATSGSFSGALASLGASVNNVTLDSPNSGPDSPPLSEFDVVLNVTEVFFDETIDETVFNVIMVSQVSIASLSFQARRNLLFVIITKK